MDTNQIKSILYRKAGGIVAAAIETGETKVALSQVINYARKTDRIRKKLKIYYGIRFNDGLMKVTRKTTRKPAKRKTLKAA